MIRKFKTLAVALVAVFALGAVVASAASAQQGFLTSTGNVTLTGTETGVEKNRFDSVWGLYRMPRQHLYRSQIQRHTTRFHSQR